MNVAKLDVSKEVAAAALLAYKKHRGVYDREDWEIERIYRAIARGKIVISVSDALRTAGLDAIGRPLLAFGRADYKAVHCRRGNDTVAFESSAWGQRKQFRIDWPGMRYSERIEAKVPRIPPQFRPKLGHLHRYHILWEADWKAAPRDPMLLRKIGADAYVVLAAWDLTEVEINVLRAPR